MNDSMLMQATYRRRELTRLPRRRREERARTRAGQPAGLGRRPGQYRGAGGRACHVVAAAMARLPEQQRVTLVLAAGELNSAALGVPAGTVRYRLSLARRTLAEALADYDDPQEEP
jgi:DNA-directed RNA polymerase specialized sigma24 family protein